MAELGYPDKGDDKRMSVPLQRLGRVHDEG